LPTAPTHTHATSLRQAEFTRFRWREFELATGSRSELQVFRLLHRRQANRPLACNSAQGQLGSQAGPFTRPLPRWWDRQARRIRSRPCRPSRSSQPIGSSHPCLARRRMTSAKMAGNSCFSRSITSLGVALRSDVTLTPFPRACMRRGIIGQMRGRKVRTAVMADPGNARRWQAGLRRMCPPMHAGVLRNLFIHLPMAKAARSPTACDIYDLKARHAAPTIVLVRWERHHTFFDS
jgi:hypothetical protein